MDGAREWIETLVPMLAISTLFWIGFFLLRMLQTGVSPAEKPKTDPAVPADPGMWGAEKPKRHMWLDDGTTLAEIVDPPSDKQP